MAVVQIVGQLVCKGGLHPAGAVAVEAHAQGDLVHGGKGHAVGLPREKIGVLLQPGQGLGSVGPVQLHGQRHRQLIPGQKLHHPLQYRQLPESGGQLHGLFGGDALDGLKPLRLLLDNGQSVCPEAVCQPLGRGGADALENAGGQVGYDLLLRPGHPPLHGLRRKLGPIAGVVGPHPGDGHALAGSGAGNAPHHRYQLPVLRQQGEHGVAVVLILKDQALYGALHRAAFGHTGPPYGKF